jgi:MFS family permease
MRLFVGCIVSLIATSFGFISRAFLLNTLGGEFKLSQEQVGALNGAGLFPFALSIIFFSLIVDKIGYGRAMVFAWLGHTISGIIMLTANSFAMLYIGTLLFAFANGTVEAVINPVTATLFPRNKTHYLNILHAGWPGGLVLGGLLFMVLGPDVHWRVKMALYLIPTAAYGLMLLGQKFPVQERVKAGVTYDDMLKEFGAGSCFIVMFFVTYAFNTVFTSLNLYKGGDVLPIAAAVGAVSAAAFGFKYRSFGRPMFVFLLLVMILLATTELGTDSWVAALMEPVLKSKNGGYLVLIYTSAIMFVLRFFAGPIVHRITPLGLLCLCAAVASGGLFFIANAGASAALLFAAATCYGFGKTFFWPTTLGVVTEQFPKGGAMTINAIAGVGMISVGVLAGPLFGAMQDSTLDARLKGADAAVHAKVAGEQKSQMLMSYQVLDRAKVAALPESERKVVEKVQGENSQASLAKVAVLPFLMFLCYVGLILYFKSKGGYKAVELTTEPAPPAPEPKPVT